jgi:hypothetical protein
MAMTVFRLQSVYDMMINELVAVARMRIGRRNRSTRRKPDPVPLCCAILYYMCEIIQRYFHIKQALFIQCIDECAQKEATV